MSARTRISFDLSGNPIAQVVEDHPPLAPAPPRTQYDLNGTAIVGSNNARSH